MNKAVPFLVSTVVAAFVLSGCGGPAKDATYENASKLREAVIASGVECPGDAVKHDDKFGEDFVKCSTKLGLTVYETDDQAGLRKTMHDVMKETYLAGPRWVIQGDDDTLAKLKDRLGGSFVVP